MNNLIRSFVNTKGTFYDLWKNGEGLYNLVVSPSDGKFVNCAYIDVGWLFKMKGFKETPDHE